MSALPFVFLTSELNVVASTTLQQGQPPSHIQIGKHFYRPHVDDIKQEFFKVKSLGSGTAEEWVKGLDNRGKEKRLDLARWERWEASGGVQRMRGDEPVEIQENVVKGKYQPSTTLPARLESFQSQPVSGLSKIPVVTNYPTSSTRFITHPIPSIPQFRELNYFFGLYFSNINIAATTLPQRFDSPVQNGFGPFPRPFYPTPRLERTIVEVDKLKAARKAEIERRCLLLDPPISPAVLSHMASFQAALQIIKPFDDSAWEMLKPRLLSQRADAQLREDDRVAQLVERLYQDGRAKEAREIVDREWEDTQIVIRNRIGAYADEIIRDKWALGKKVNKETSPKFAAEILIYVRKRFYAEIAKDDAAAQAAGQNAQMDPPNGPFARKLTLENMRWVFDTKIKPHTDQYRKELFLCNGCENFKWYAFEGVCQHYASKHTSALSSGSIVVHWRAEWPQEPPFNPEANLVKNLSFPGPSSATSYANGTPTSALTFGYGGFQGSSLPIAPPTHLPPAPAYQSLPGPYSGPPQVPQIPEPYPQQQPAPFVPAQFQTYPQTFQASQYQAPQANGYQPYGAYPQPSFEMQYTSALPLVYEASQVNQPFPISNPESSVPIQTQTLPVATEVPSHIPPVVHRTEAYNSQLQDIALIAKGLWNSTAGVKDMPGSVRVYTILYHLLQRSREKYADDPSLSMLIDGIQNIKKMRPVRNINGLACKTCTLERASRPINPHTVSSKGSGTTDRKLYSFPQLLNHFQSAHIENAKPNAYKSPSDIDWKTDMVELPHKKKIRALSGSSGMDEYKLLLVKEALPDAFEPDTPEPEVEAPQQIYRELPQEKGHQLAPSKDKHEQYYTMPLQRSPSPPETGQDVFDTSVVIPPTAKSRFANSSEDYAGQPPVNYIDRRVASPMDDRRHTLLQVEDDQRISSCDNRFYTAQLGSYRQLDDRDKRDRISRTPAIVSRLRAIPPHPEYDHQEADLLPRLIEKAGRLAKPQSPQYQKQPSGARVSEIYYRGEPRPRSVANISKTSVSQQWSRVEVGDRGSEDGELRNQLKANDVTATKTTSTSTEARIAAEQFLNNMLPADLSEHAVTKAEESQRQDEEVLTSRWAVERAEGIRPICKPAVEQEQRPPYGSRGEEYQAPSQRSIKRNNSLSPSNARPKFEHVSARQPQYLPYDYDDRIEAAPRPVYVRRRSPDMVDRHYVVDDAIYDERQINQQAHSRNARYTGYEGLRYEDEPPVSRSPVYVIDPMPERRQYRAVSPGGRRYAQEPIYEARPSQQPIEQVAYERVPRQEYYRVYSDEQAQPRRPQYETQIEYVRVADPQGDYVIERPVRREQREHEPIYDSYGETPRYEEASRQRQPIYEEERRQRQPVYEDDPRQRQPVCEDDPRQRQAVYDEEPRQRQAVYEEEPRQRQRQPAYDRAPLSRNDPAYYEEYDPRHPAPPPEASFRPLRYE
jgi:hypothetical protein